MTKAYEVQRATGKDVVSVLLEGATSPNVVSNTVTAFTHLGVSDLIEMVNSVSLDKLVYGLSIIKGEQIKSISVDKLKCVLQFGNMYTISKVQDTFKDNSVEVALSKLSLDELRSLLVEDNLEVIISTIRLLNNVVCGGYKICVRNQFIL